MTSLPLQLKHFIDDTLINQINLKQLYQLPFTPQQSAIDGVIKKVNTVRESFFVGEVS